MVKREFRLRYGNEDRRSEKQGGNSPKADREDLQTLSLVVTRTGNAILILSSDGAVQRSNEGEGANEAKGKGIF